MITKQILFDYLKHSEAQNLNGLSKIKTIYRPYICPFDDILNKIPNNTSIFDIGCGSGSFLSLVSNFTAPQKIGGIEISEHLIENAKQLLAKFKIEQHIYKYDGSNIPNEIVDFDIISMIDVYHHIPVAFQVSFMKELYSKMKPGSTLIFKDINQANPLVIMNKLHDLLLSSEIGHEISFKNAQNLLKDLGFVILEKSKRTMLFYPHFTIYARKKLGS